MEIVSIYGKVLQTYPAEDLRNANLRNADLSDADLSDANLRYANLSSANLSGKKVNKMRVFTGLYSYQVWAVLFDDGERWIRMGCLWKSLSEWEAIGIRETNVCEFPNDGSERSEERAASYEFALATVRRLK